MNEAKKERLTDSLVWVPDLRVCVYVLCSQRTVYLYAEIEKVFFLNAICST